MAIRNRDASGRPCSAARRSAAARLADERPAEEREAGVVAGVNQRHVAQLASALTRALVAETGVARAMFEPTVMAQMASWSHGSRYP